MMTRVASKIDALFSIYDLLIGKHPVVHQLLEDYKEAKKKLEIVDERNKERKVQEVAKKILAKLNKIITGLKESKIIQFTTSTAIQGFLAKHGTCLKIINTINAIVFKDIPRHMIGQDNVDLNAIFAAVDEKKGIINISLREAIMNGMIDKNIPEWIPVLVNNNHLVDQENKELLEMVTQRMQLFQ